MSTFFKQMLVSSVCVLFLSACGSGSSSSGAGGNTAGTNGSGSSGNSFQLTQLVLESEMSTGTYPVTVRFVGEAEASVEELCLTYNGEGPFCDPVEGSVQVTASSVTRTAVTNNPGTYDVAAFVRLADGQTSNVVSKQVVFN